MTVIPLNPGPYAFAVDTAASVSQINSIYLKAGTRVMILDTGLEQFYNGSAWTEVALADAGDVAYDDANSYTAKTTVETVLDELYTYRPLYSTLTADTAPASQDTTVNATGLTVTLPIAGTYDLEAFLPYTAHADGDIKFQFGGTATVTATVGVSDIYYMMGPLIDGDASTHQAVPVLLPTSWTTAYPITTTGTPALFPTLFKGRLVATVAGTIIVSFAQVTSTVHNTLVGKGAYLKLQRVA